MIRLFSSVANVISLDNIVPRDFMEIRARRRDTGAEVIDYLWSGVENVEHTVRDPLTGNLKNCNMGRCGSSDWRWISAPRIKFNNYPHRNSYVGSF